MNRPNSKKRKQSKKRTRSAEPEIHKKDIKLQKLTIRSENPPFLCWIRKVGWLIQSEAVIVVHLYGDVVVDGRKGSFEGDDVSSLGAFFCPENKSKRGKKKCNTLACAPFLLSGYTEEVR
jgi:hypothetical protein